MPIYKKLGFAVSALILAATGLVLLITGDLLALLVGLIGLILTAMIMQIYKRLRDLDLRHDHFMRQSPALLALTGSLGLRGSLPFFDEYVVLPDFALYLANLVRHHRPLAILETGSGVSTVVMAYALEANGKGRLVSLDEKEPFAERTRELLAQHGLQAAADVRHAPITPVTLESGTYHWYDTAQIADIETIDLLIVDGPIDWQSRRSALPVLLPHLSADAVVVLDDAHDAQVQAMAMTWAKDYGFSLEEIGTERGALLLRRQPPVPAP